MKTCFTSCFSILLTAALYFAPALSGPARPAGKNVPLAKLPPEVQKTIQAQLGHGKVGRILRTSEDGDFAFSAFFVKEGKERIMTVAKDGTLLSVEVFLEELPPAVAGTVRQQLKGGKPSQILKDLQDGAVSYFIQMTQAGTDRCFVVADDGALTSAEVFLAELPAAVQKAVRDRVGDGGLTQIRKSVENGNTSFAVDVTKTEGDQTFTLAEDGVLINGLVTLAEVPAAAQKTIREQVGQGTLVFITNDLQHDKASFAVELTQAGQPRSLTVMENGLLTCATMLLEEVSAPVRKTITDKLGDGQLGQIRKDIEEGKATYSIDLTRAGKAQNFTLAEDGAVINGPVSLRETPASVQKTIGAQLGGGELQQITVNMGDGQTNYEFTVKLEGTDLSFSVAGDGQLTGAQMLLDQVPPPVQQTIRKQLGDGKLGQIHKNVEDNGGTYDVTMIQAEQERTFTLREDGTLTSAQMFLKEVPAPVRRTIQEQLGGCKLGRITKNIDGDTTTYEAEIIEPEKTVTINVAADGALHN